MFEGIKVVDIHGHMSSPPQFRAYAYSLICHRSTTSRLKLTSVDLENALDRHLSMLDERMIDIQFISPRPVAMMHWESSDLVAHWTETTNDIIAQQCQSSGGRLIGVGQLPQSIGKTTDNCVEELRRCVGDLGFVGALLNPDPASDGRAPGVDEEYWFPLYEAASGLGATLMVHPSFSRDPRLSKIPHSFQYNFMVQETLATLLFEHSDVFERFPDLKVVVCHCGGSPNRLFRLGAVGSSGVEASGIMPGGSVQMPIESTEERVPDRSENLFFDTCAYDPFYLETAIRQRGASQMLLGTEVPGAGTAYLNPMTGLPADALVQVIAGFDFLSVEEKIDIFSRNVSEAFDLWHGESAAEVVPIRKIRDLPFRTEGL